MRLILKLGQRMIVLPILTERLIIRQFILEDLPAYLAFMLDAESTQYLAF